MRVVFLGTPLFATIPLRALIHDSRYEVVGVVTQPDRPTGRRRTIQPPPVKELAVEYGIPVFQPETLRDADAIEQLAAFRPDVGVVAAYGEILRKQVLAIPPLGYINLHPSLLPLHRGPTPVIGAILSGDTETGMTIMQLVSKMDAGPILSQQRVPLAPDARTEQLTNELFHSGSERLVEVLASYAAGTIELIPQDDSQASYTRMLNRTDGLIDWHSSAIQIERMIRAYDPWPSAYTNWNGQTLKIIQAQPIPDWVGNETPGTLFVDQKMICVATGRGALQLFSVQPSGKQNMLADSWYRGLRGVTEICLGT
ncbi:MAG: methionyl-tRNA formyltransferase [Chloroflexi bacterium AL-W]|nr:methionyl-tRNA formyltransferase [Chloroflexi bacterium AL-N1]NOK70578.1 methionyl-tRNA formyltransferase [Chloroflexi bacterium AL-N10]NOK77570.1 methionyl-tRNA formyltransferase [Chloroflexi bacterium AL-N5]NOK84421.1 methionyl-tRNA formyltransferase [Chloroflexi bacterium AL-W]NOK92310.1 methionyl-tRNA formyltransferase [Chloroflexi bacterium AL-N15]